MTVGSHWVGALASSLPLLLSSCCCSQEWREKNDREHAAGDKEYVGFAKQLGDVHRTLPVSPGEKRCDDAKIKAKKTAHGSWYGAMSTVDLEFLAPFDGGAAPSDTWRFLRTGWAQGLAPPGKSYDNANRMRELRREGTFGVLRTTVRQLPTGVDEKGFVGGRLEGWLVVLDVANMKPMCSAAVKAQSSDVVALFRNLRPPSGRARRNSGPAGSSRRTPPRPFRTTSRTTCTRP